MNIEVWFAIAGFILMLISWLWMLVKASNLESKGWAWGMFLIPFAVFPFFGFRYPNLVGIPSILYGIGFVSFWGAIVFLE